MSTMDSIMVDYLLEELRVAKKKSLDDVASKVYGDKNLPQSRLKLYRLRKPKADGTIKKLTLEDFIAICHALDESPVEILARKLEAMKAKKFETSEG